MVILTAYFTFSSAHNIFFMYDCTFKFVRDIFVFREMCLGAAHNNNVVGPCRSGVCGAKNVLYSKLTNSVLHGKFTTVSVLGYTYQDLGPYCSLSY